MRAFAIAATILTAGMTSLADNPRDRDFDTVLRRFSNKSFATQVTFTKDQTIESLIKLGDLTGRESPLAILGLADGLNATVEQLRKASDTLEYLLIFLEDGKIPASAIREQIGNEENRSSGDFYTPKRSGVPARVQNERTDGSKPLTWHEFDWLHCGIVEGNVAVLRIDCKKYIPTKKSNPVADRNCRVFIHVVPENKQLSMVGTGDDLTRLTTSVVPQVRESAKKLEELFGPPDQIEKSQEKKFYERGRTGLPFMKTVNGDCWVYGPLTLMLNDGKVSYIWVEGKDTFGEIARVYEQKVRPDAAEFKYSPSPRKR